MRSLLSIGLAVCALSMCFSADAHAQGKNVQRTHNVDDLIPPVVAGETSKDTSKRQALVQEVECFIVGSVDQDNWERNGGENTLTYRPLTQGFVVNAPVDVQEQITDLLAAIRQVKASQVLLEIRLLLVSDTGYGTLVERFSLPADPTEALKPGDKKSNAIVKYLRSHSCAKLLSEPRIMATGGTKARFESTTPVKVLTGLRTKKSKSGSLIVEPEMQEMVSSTTFVCTPTIKVDGTISVHVKAELKSVASAKPALVPAVVMAKGKQSVAGVEPQAVQRPYKVETDKDGKLLGFRTMVQRAQQHVEAIEEEMAVNSGEMILIVGKSFRRPVTWSHPEVPLLPALLPGVSTWFRHHEATTEDSRYVITITPKFATE